MSGPTLASLPRRPEAMLLDFDGVILVSAELKTRAFAKVYADEDPEKVTEVIAYQRAHGGVSRLEKFVHYENNIFGRPATETRVRELADRFVGIALDDVLRAPFVAGALDFLEATCRETRLHVVSGTPETELRRIVEDRGLSRFFRSVAGAPETKYDAFARILDEEGIAADRALAVGDSTTEFDAARALAIPFLGVLDEDGVSAFPPDVPVVADLSGVAAGLGFGQG